MLKKKTTRRYHLTPVRMAIIKKSRPPLGDHLEGWDREGGKEGDARGKRYRDMYIYS